MAFALLSIINKFTVAYFLTRNIGLVSDGQTNEEFYSITVQNALFQFQFLQFWFFCIKYLQSAH